MTLLQRITDMEMWCFRLASWSLTQDEWKPAARDFLDLAYLLGDLREELEDDNGT